MSIILYSTGCPKCRVLKTKLESKHIPYIENNNVVEMRSLGISTVPVLSLDGKLLQFMEANNWINEQPSTTNID